MDESPNRRDFLIRVSEGAAGLLGLSLFGCEQIDIQTKTTGDRPSFITTPANSDRTWFWQSGAGTSIEDAPEIAREEWSASLEVNGSREQRLEFSDLQQRADAGEAITFVKTMQCVVTPARVGRLASSVYTATGIFTGIPFHRFLEPLALPDTPARVRVDGADGWETNVLFDRAMRGQPDQLPVCLAYELNGSRMSAKRGGPVRLVVPEAYGYKNMKWVDRINVTESDQPYGGYETGLFSGNDYIDRDGAMGLESIVTKPPQQEGASLQGPNIRIAGASYAGGAAISGLELSLDGGSWREIQLPSEDDLLQDVDDTLRSAYAEAVNTGDGFPIPNVWIPFSHVLRNVSTGAHTLRLRAIDSRDFTQGNESESDFKITEPTRLDFQVE